MVLFFLSLSAAVNLGYSLMLVSNSACLLFGVFG